MLAGSQPRVGGFLQAFADQVVSQHGRENGCAGKEHQPPQIQIGPTRVEQRSPAWVRRRVPRPRKLNRFRRVSPSDAERYRHQHRRPASSGRMWRKMIRPLPAPRATGGGHELAAAELEEFAADEPGNRGPAGESKTTIMPSVGSLRIAISAKDQTRAAGTSRLR